jgi:hypothetical protein
MVEKPQATRRRVQKGPRPKTPDRKGRVTHVRYSQAVARKICERLAKGEPWFSICNTDDLPCYASLYTWSDRYPEFAEAVARARQQGADYCADKALAVAEASTKETVQQDRLLVNTLMRRAAVIAPRAWGGKTEKPAKATPQPVEVVFRVRHFEKVVGPDGKAFVREIKPEGLA